MEDTLPTPPPTGLSFRLLGLSLSPPPPLEDDEDESEEPGSSLLNFEANDPLAKPTNNEEPSEGALPLPFLPP